MIRLLKVDDLLYEKDQKDAARIIREHLSINLSGENRREWVHNLIFNIKQGEH